jgi:hypothetical protein
VFCVEDAKESAEKEKRAREKAAKQAALDAQFGKTISNTNDYSFH